MSWTGRLLNTLRPDRLARELDAELASHIAERADDLVAGGMSRAEAEAEARRRFGNRGTQQENARSADSFGWLEAAFADLRYGARALRLTPGFTLVALLSLALGIGANTAIFSLVNAMALRDLPVAHPEELVMVQMSGSHILTNPLWEQLHRQSSVFGSSLAYSHATFNLSTGGPVQEAPGSWVSGSYFHALGVRPAAGRLLQAADDVRGCGAVAVASAGFAVRRFGSIENAVGKVVSLDGHPFPVVGVAQPGFSGVEVGQPVDLFAPLCAEQLTSTEKNILDQRSRWYLTMLARPLPGLSLTQVNERLKVLGPGIAEATLPANATGDRRSGYLKNGFSVVAAPGGQSDVRETYRKALLLLMVVSGAVLLIACANIANLLLARAAARQREMAIRLAIGAGRGRLLRQLLTESLLLSSGGAVAGVLFARWASQLLIGFLGARGAPVTLDLSLDLRVLAFAVAIATATGLLFGLAPAWRATRVDPQLAMKSGGRGVMRDSRQRIGKALVAGQVALSLALIASAALLVGSFRRLTQVDLGFRREGVLLVNTDFGVAGFTGADLLSQPLEMLRRLREIPGVQVSASLVTPISHRGWNDVVIVPGFAPTSMRDSLAWFNQASDGYFATMGSRLISGRDFTTADIANGRHVAIIDQTMAHKVFAADNPLGRTFRTPAYGGGDSLGIPYEVIGVVEDAKYNNVNEPLQPTAYYPLGGGGNLSDNLNYELRTSRPMGEVFDAVNRVAASISPAIALRATTLDDQVSNSLQRPRLLAVLSGFFGLLALLLAMIGLYGTIAYSVAQRRNEIGIRVALGAAQARVVQLVVGDAARIVVAGLVIGAGLTYVFTRVLASFLYGVTPTDPAALTGSALALAVTALAAASLPAWRASRLDPMTALREE